MRKRLLSMLLIFSMIFSLFPVAAMAGETAGTGGEIIAFASLAETEKSVSVGTALRDLELSEFLTATVRTVAGAVYEDRELNLPAAWTAEPEYNPDSEGIYIFTPDIKGYAVSAVLPEISVTVGAAVMGKGMFGPMSATLYNVWVGGVQVTSANASDVLSDGKVIYTPAAEGSAQTLTLNGADIGAEMQYTWISNPVVDAKAYAAVYAKENLNVVLTGNNSLTGGSQDSIYDESFGLYCGGALTITGGGTLETIGATMDKPSCHSYGLFVKGTLSIGDGTTVTARGGDVSGGNGVSFGVFGKDGGGLTIENATLTVASGTGYNSYGVRIMQGDISITNSNVTATSGTTPQYSRALEAYAGNISISGGTVSASAENGVNPAYCIAICVPSDKNITISSGAVVTAQAGMTAVGGRAMSKAPNLDSYGSEYYITASEAYNGGSPETYNASNVNNYRYLDMRQGTATPTTDTTSASKSSASQNSISFTLTNSSAYTSALTWKVYSGSTGQVLANGVTATKSGDTLTLSHSVNIPAATYYVAVTESGKAESGRLALTVGAFVPASLTGTATISNTAPRIGDTLTASLVGGNNTGTLNYVWKAGVFQVGTGASYTVTAADFGAVITLEITSSVETGTVSSAPTTAVAKKSAPSAPGAPTLLLKTHNTVMLTANNDYDFSKDGIEWQASNVFIGLSENTKYTFYQRITGTLDTEPSAASVGFDVTTDAATYTITANPTSKDFGSLAVGYSAPAAQTVTIRNTGNSSVTLTQPSSTNYTIGTLSTTTLAANGTATFTVAPEAGLAVGNYNETLTVNTNHSTNATVELSFSVMAAPTYTITASPTSKNFGSLTAGYSAPAAQTVTITNTGNSGVTLTQPASTNYTIGALSDTILAAGGTATFTVLPKRGLAAGNYGETLTVSTDHSTSATVGLSFTVTPPAPAATKTITATAGTGGSISPSGEVRVNNGASQTFTITPDSNYAIADVKVDNVSQGSITSYTFTNVTADHTISAAFSYNGGGGSGGSSSGGERADNNSSNITVITPPASSPDIPTQVEIRAAGEIDNAGNMTVNITEQNIAEAIERARADARKNGNEQNGITLVLNISPGNQDINTVTVNLPQTIQDMIISQGIVNTVVVVDNPDIAIGLDLAAVTEINRQAGGDVDVSAARLDNDDLSGVARNAIGSRPVFELRVSYGGSEAVESFGDGQVSVAIPYILGPGEEASNIWAVYVDGSGQVHWLDSSDYDSVNQILTFTADHFSAYGVGYREPEPVFSDIGRHWAKDDIYRAVKQGLFSGTSADTFSPEKKITRGMFVTVIGRLAEAKVSSYSKSSFADVQEDAYYMPYIEWAAQNNLVKGTGAGNFAPDQTVTREQMAAIISNYAQATGFTLAQVQEENSFADRDNISGYAREAVSRMQRAGVMAGRNYNNFDPQGPATRAEAAAVLVRFMELAISTDK